MNVTRLGKCTAIQSRKQGSKLDTYWWGNFTVIHENSWTLDDRYVCMYVRCYEKADIVYGVHPSRNIYKGQNIILSSKDKVIMNVLNCMLTLMFLYACLCNRCWKYSQKKWIMTIGNDCIISIVQSTPCFYQKELR